MQWGWGPARRAARRRAAGVMLAVAVPLAAGGALAAALASTSADGAGPRPAPAVDRMAGSPAGLTAKPGRSVNEAPPATSRPGSTVPTANPPSPDPPPTVPSPPPTAAPPHPVDLLGDPTANVAPVPAFQEPPGPCWSLGGLATFSQPACLAAELRATDHARAREGLPALTLPGDYRSLTPEEQLFVVTDIERVSRGLQPVLGLSSVLDRDAQQGASDNVDPGFSAMATLPTAQRGVSNWGASMSPLDVNYYWMYLDGWGGSAARTYNVDCPAPGAHGCWAHRDNVLMPGGAVVMGAGFAPDNWNGYNSYSEVLVALASPDAAPPLYYTWDQAVADGAS